MSHPQHRAGFQQYFKVLGSPRPPVAFEDLKIVCVLERIDESRRNCFDGGELADVRVEGTNNSYNSEVSEVLHRDSV